MTENGVDALEFKIIATGANEWLQKVVGVLQLGSFNRLVACVSRRRGRTISQRCHQPIDPYLILLRFSRTHLLPMIPSNHIRRFDYSLS
jgi:hypothetical protein